jgi:hypothetical protein
MDRQKQHISAIGDQRAPPKMRDIKLEAILGQQIDELKEEINKAIQLISGFQFGKLDEKKIDRLLKLKVKDQSKVNSELNPETADGDLAPKVKTEVPNVKKSEEKETETEEGADDEVLETFSNDIQQQDDFVPSYFYY